MRHILVSLVTAFLLSLIIGLGTFQSKVQAERVKLPEEYKLQENEFQPVYLKDGEYYYGEVYVRDLGQFETVPDFVTKAADIIATTINLTPEISNATKYSSDLQHDPSKNKEKWIRTPADIRLKKKYSIEPFNIRLTGLYGNNKTDISMTYHFGAYNHGYIMRMTDGSKSSHIKGYIGILPEKSIEYSNVHDNGNDPIRKTMEEPLENGKTWDARTILGGEGARFSAVKSLFDNGELKNRSNFYIIVKGEKVICNPNESVKKDGKAICNPDKNEYVKAITLENLWGLWGSKFKHKFGIADSVIADYLQRSQARVTKMKCTDIQSLCDYNVGPKCVNNVGLK